MLSCVCLNLNIKVPPTPRGDDSSLYPSFPPFSSTLSLSSCVLFLPTILICGSVLSALPGIGEKVIWPGFWPGWVAISCCCMRQLFLRRRGGRLCAECAQGGRGCQSTCHWLTFYKLSVGCSKFISWVSGRRQLVGRQRMLPAFWC